MNALNLSRKLAALTRADYLMTLVMLAGFLTPALPLRADNPPTYLFQWGSHGNGNGQFIEPWGIAVDSSNSIYVTDADNDSGNPRVEKFEHNGNYLTQWGSPGNGNGQLQFPCAVAVDSGNNVFVADANNNRVEKFNCNGNYLTQWGGYGIDNGTFSEPGGIAVDSSNNVYVFDEGNDRLEKFDNQGNYLTQWGSLGIGNGLFNGIVGIAVDSNNEVYVVDSSNYRVEKFEGNGNYLTQWGSYGIGNGQFYYPSSIAVDSTGNFIYVSDIENPRIPFMPKSLHSVPQR